MKRLKNRSCDKLIIGFNCFSVLQCRSRRPARHVVALHYRNQVICRRLWAYSKGSKTHGKSFAVGKHTTNQFSKHLIAVCFLFDVSLSLASRKLDICRGSRQFAHSKLPCLRLLNDTSRCLYCIRSPVLYRVHRVISLEEESDRWTVYVRYISTPQP
jgi:hypothetical protein